jgi:biopolymer transport protein ExbD
VRKGQKPADSGGIYEINMTPLIDVCLVLVVILMVATPLALQSSIGLRTAAAHARAASQGAAPPRIEIAVLSEASVRVNREVVARAALHDVLARVIHDAPGPLVVVRCADDVPHGTFVSVLDEVRSQGAYNIAVVGR